MSATNRGAERVEDDAYPTPAWCVRRLLEGLETAYGAQIPVDNWHEIAAGTGGIIRAVQEYRPMRVGRWFATELRENDELPFTPGLYAFAFEDFLTQKPFRSDVAITNPPFAIAEAMIKKSLERADWVVMLLRSSFKSSARADWLRNEMPDQFDLPNRPSFIASYNCEPRDAHDRGCGWTKKTPIDAPRIKLCPSCGRKVTRSTSDSAEYAWFVWTPERGRSVGQTRILASTPKLERKVIVKEAA